jgi:broad specificity phosphatase PhoE
MKPKRIILVRHGESKGNVDRSAYATIQDHALKLTENGVEQARLAGEEIKALVGDETVHFWVSPYARTRQTFENVLQAFSVEQVVSAFEHWGIREQDWGHTRDADTTRRLETERDAYGTTFYRFTNGESVADVWDRMSDFIDTLWRDFADPTFKAENVIVVTHGRTMRVFCARWFHWTVEYAEALCNPKNCEIWVMSAQAPGPDGHKPNFQLINLPRCQREGVEQVPHLLRDFRRAKSPGPK